MKMWAVSIRVLLAAAMVVLPLWPCCCGGAEHEAAAAMAVNAAAGAGSDCCAAGDSGMNGLGRRGGDAPGRDSRDGSCGECHFYVDGHGGRVQPAVAGVSGGWLMIAAFDFGRPVGLVVGVSLGDVVRFDGGSHAMGRGDSLRALSCLLTV